MTNAQYFGMFGAICLIPVITMPCLAIRSFQEARSNIWMTQTSKAFFALTTMVLFMWQLSQRGWTFLWISIQFFDISTKIFNRKLNLFYQFILSEHKLKQTGITHQLRASGGSSPAKIVTINCKSPPFAQCLVKKITAL